MDHVLLVIIPHNEAYHALLVITPHNDPLIKARLPSSMTIIPRSGCSRPWRRGVVTVRGEQHIHLVEESG